MTTTGLHDDDLGRWEIQTATSTYVLDLDHRTMTRYPGTVTEGQLPRTTGSGRQVTESQAAQPPAAELRRDGSRVPLLQVLRCSPGASMLLLLDLRGDGVPTVRQSTEVLTITPLSARPAGGAAGTRSATPDPRHQPAEGRAGRNQPTHGTDPDNATEEQPNNSDGRHRPGRPGPRVNAARQEVKRSRHDSGPGTDQNGEAAASHDSGHDSGQPSAPLPRSPWAAAIGPAYRTQELADTLGTTPEGVARLVLTNRLLQVTTTDGVDLYPTWQIRAGQPLPGLAGLLNALPQKVVDRWTLAAWCVLPQPELSGATVADALNHEAMAQAVGRLVRHAASRWSR